MNPGLTRKTEPVKGLVIHHGQAELSAGVVRVEGVPVAVGQGDPLLLKTNHHNNKDGNYYIIR